MGDLTNPLQNLINQAAQLPNSGQLEQYAQTVNPTSGIKALVLDLSGSMSQRVGGDRKIDILHQAIAGLPLQQYVILLFNSKTEVFQGGTFPEPSGGTALHMALGATATLNPEHTLIVSDGMPDDEDQALEAAISLPGRISTLYIGSDDNHEAIAFMRRVAAIKGGEFYNQDLRTGSILLLNQIQRMLPGV